MEEYKTIKIFENDKIKGFYILLTKAKNSFTCLPDNTFFVKKQDLEELVKEDINFKEL